MRRFTHSFSLIALLGVCAAARADSITLKDGSRVDGDLKRNGDGSGWIITTADGKSRTIPGDSVKSVELGIASQPAGGVQSAEALASLRRSVEAISDLNQIIDRYQRFINSAKDPAIIADATNDLKLWQARKAQGLVKYGSNWVTPQEVAGIRERALSLAERAREAIRAGVIRDADQLIQQALAVDPSNPAANYLKGVLLFRQDKIADARKAFDAANAAFPNHPPTLNNLAVILWRQNQQAGALTFYDQAMLASGANEYILNNVAEALGTIPEDQRKAAPIARALRRFSDLDQTLQQQNAIQGRFRWGGSWIDQKQLDQLKAAEKEVRTKLESMQKDFDAAKARITEIDREIAYNDEQMNELRLRTRMRDANGNYITYPLPQIYYDLDRRNTLLRAEQNRMRAQMASLQDDVAKVQQGVPVPKFTGVQQIVGVEGMPLSVPVLPTTTPAP